MAKRINPHHLTTTKPRLIAVVPTAILTLVLLSLSTAPAYEQGTYYSAKDPDLAPYPFNPHPNLPLVAVAPGIFVVDDLTVPDTPEQLASRIAREEARKAAEKLGPEGLKQMAEEAVLRSEEAWNLKKAAIRARAAAIEAGLLPMPMGAQASSSGVDLKVELSGNNLAFTITGAEPYAIYDLYYLPDLLMERWEWQPIVMGIVCDITGTGTTTLAPPNPTMGYFMALCHTADTDNDGLSDYGEIVQWNSDPFDEHTFNGTKDDSEYLFTAELNDANTLASLQMTDLGNDWLQFTISGAPAAAHYDLYYLSSQTAQDNWRWRPVYSGAVCDSSGSAVFLIKKPESAGGHYIALAASDMDQDGLTDGYEAWFKEKESEDPEALWLRSVVDVLDSDGDGMADGWEVQYGLNPMDATGINGATADPDGDGYNNKAEHDSYFSSPTYVDASYDPLKPQLPYGSNRPVVTISAGTSPCSYSATFTITRWPDYGADLSSPLTVYYAVGGNLTYGIDYTLAPAPLTSDYPRIFSVVIKSGEASTNVNVNPTGWPLNSPTMAVALTPYGVGASPQVPAQVGGQWQNYAGKWDYVVDLKGQQDRVTLTMPAPPSFSDLPLLSAVCGPNSIFLHWDIIPPEFGGLEGYVVNRRTTPAGVYEEIYSTTDPDEKSYEDTSVVQGVTYCYLVVAKVRDPGTWELCELPSNEECLSTCDPPPCNEPSISGWIFTDQGFIAGGQQGAFRLYEDPNDAPASPWTLQESSGSLNVRMDYEDDYNCELYNENIQAATAEAVITVAPGCPAQLTVDWNGMVEQHDTGYDRMWLFVDENQIDYAQSTQRQQGCAPMVSTNGYQSALLQPGFHLLRIETDTGDDGNYQSSAFYEFDIDFD